MLACSAVYSLVHSATRQLVIIDKNQYGTLFLMSELAHVRRNHQYKATCTGTTSGLYWYYKVLVVALQGACSPTTNGIVLSKCCCADTLKAKWGMRTSF